MLDIGIYFRQCMFENREINIVSYVIQVSPISFKYTLIKLHSV